MFSSFMSFFALYVPIIYYFCASATSASLQILRLDVNAEISAFSRFQEIYRAMTGCFKGKKMQRLQRSLHLRLISFAADLQRL